MSANKTLLLEDMLAAVDPNTVICKADKLDPEKDTKVGVMNDRLKRIYGLHRNFVTKTNEIIRTIKIKKAEHDLAHLKKETDYEEIEKGSCCEEFSKIANETLKNIELNKERLNALDQIFWNTARLDFPELLGKPEIGVREGFSLVWCNKNYLESLEKEAEDIVRLLSLINPARSGFTSNPFGF